MESGIGRMYGTDAGIAHLAEAVGNRTVLDGIRDKPADFSDNALSVFADVVFIL